MIKNTSPIPNVILDVWMSKLQPTEFKTMMAILRQTIGWIDRTTKGRKLRDRLTVGRLSTMTGCSKRAVSMALDALLQHGLIVITLLDGTNASDPQVRQGRMLLMGPHADVLKQSVPIGSEKTAEDDLQPLQTTKESVLNKEKDSFSCQESIQAMHDSKDRTMNVIAYWMERKGIRPKDTAQLDIITARHREKAKEVACFSDDEIVKVCDRLDREFPDYTPNTILSTLTR